jgi:hypothetical protein
LIVTAIRKSGVTIPGRSLRSAIPSLLCRKTDAITATERRVVELKGSERPDGVGTYALFEAEDSGIATSGPLVTSGTGGAGRTAD